MPLLLVLTKNTAHSGTGDRWTDSTLWPLCHLPTLNTSKMTLGHFTVKCNLFLGGLLSIFSFFNVKMHECFIFLRVIISSRKRDYRLKCIKGSIYILYYISLIYLNPDIYSLIWGFISINLHTWLVFISFPHPESQKKSLNALKFVSRLE